jgi:hypothetical protein
MRNSDENIPTWIGFCFIFVSVLAVSAELCVECDGVVFGGVGGVFELWKDVRVILGLNFWINFVVLMKFMYSSIKIDVFLNKILMYLLN